MKRNSLDLTAICFAWILLWALLKSPKRFLTDVCVCVFFDVLLVGGLEPSNFMLHNYGNNNPS